jgi:hypothetical protein
LQYGMTGLRQLNLGNAMIEGFSAAKQIEPNVRNLEACMKMIVNTGAGFTSPYCWKLFAGQKSYGTFLITNISVRETMRDMTGNATRAFADIQLHEVSPYQIESGIDLASRAEFAPAPATPEPTQDTPANQDAQVEKDKTDEPVEPKPGEDHWGDKKPYNPTDADKKAERIKKARGG